MLKNPHTKDNRMSQNNGRIPILTPQQMAAMPQPVIQQVAAPMNDLQLIALMASHVNAVPRGESIPTAAERVELATDIFAEVVAQMNNGSINAKVASRRKTDEPPPAS